MTSTLEIGAADAPAPDGPTVIPARVGTGQAVRVLRRVATPVIDCLTWSGGLLLADLMRYQFDPGRAFARDLASMVLVAVVLQLAVGTLTQLYRVRWRIASFEESLVLSFTIGSVATILLGVNVAGPIHRVPSSAVVAGAAMALVTSATIRSGWRLLTERTLRPASTAPPAIIFGVGHAGTQLVNALLVNPSSPYRPVALIDDDPAKQRLRIRHLRVNGRSDKLVQVAAETGAEAVIVAIPSADASLIRRVSEMVAESGLRVLVMPPVHELLTDRVGPETIRPVTPEDLLGRRVIETDVRSIAGYLGGRRVLVTGAGGSIGSELCRQLALFEPERLVMLDRDESALHAVQLSIEGRALLDTRNLVVCDIRDRDALGKVFAEHVPDVVFHAAALKHLPLLEMWPFEAFKTNVIGTRNVLETALEFGVTRFVNISTDKAANPTSILGYSKRAAERLTASAGRSAAGTYLSVRFGNVLGSRGSVLTAFREQISMGGPVTVTHPEVTRYFMTVGEAVQLVIQAGAIGESGEVLVLDMGQPVRIADVAQRLILEAGKEIDVIFTGLRPGEKLHEELFGDSETDDRRRHPLVSHCRVHPLAFEDIPAVSPDLAHTQIRQTLARISSHPAPSCNTQPGQVATTRQTASAD